MKGEDANPLEQVPLTPVVRTPSYALAKALRILFYTIPVIILVAAVAYTLATRDKRRFVVDGFPWIVVFTIWLLVQFSVRLKKFLEISESRRMRDDGSVFAAVSGCVANVSAIPYFAISQIALCLFYSYLAYSLSVSIKDIFTKNTNAAVAVATVTALSAGFFFFRLRWRSVYGLTEVFLGLAVAIQKAQEISDPSSAMNSNWILAFATASIYLMVRGLDNIHQGLTKPPIDMVAYAFVNGKKRAEEINRELNAKH